MLIGAIAWLFIIASWVLPSRIFKENEIKQKSLELILLSFGAGISIGSLLEKFLLYGVDRN